MCLITPTSLHLQFAQTEQAMPGNRHRCARWRCARTALSELQGQPWVRCESSAAAGRFHQRRRRRRGGGGRAAPAHARIRPSNPHTTAAEALSAAAISAPRLAPSVRRRPSVSQRRLLPRGTTAARRLGFSARRGRETRRRWMVGKGRHRRWLGGTPLAPRCSQMAYRCCRRSVSGVSIGCRCPVSEAAYLYLHRSRPTAAARSLSW